METLPRVICSMGFPWNSGDLLNRTSDPGGHGIRHVTAPVCTALRTGLSPNRQAKGGSRAGVLFLDGSSTGTWRPLCGHEAGAGSVSGRLPVVSCAVAAPVFTSAASTTCRSAKKQGLLTAFTLPL